MPGMNGFELQRKLATIHCEIPVIFVTAHGDEDVRARALNAGAVDYLLKPAQTI
ncbi:MAG TPA: response regulator [Candidatus Binatia bacterium]|nr:response regulator [Candidatus Binatia bacterium]